jgi:lipopolysaccharide biosynthesis protein
MKTVQSQKLDLIVVLGMHRSGTSTITRALEVLGVDLGANLMPPAANNNSKGFFEDLDVLDFNISLLNHLGLDWHHAAPVTDSQVSDLCESGYLLKAASLIREKTNSKKPYGVKDPRLSKLMPFWKGAFQHCQLDVGYIIAIRNPISIAKSLNKRDGFSFEKSYLLWLDHVLAALMHTEGTNRIVVDFDLLIENPAKEIGRLAEAFDLPVDAEAMSDYTLEFLDEKLRHNMDQPEDLAIDSRISPLIRELYSMLREAATTDHPLLMHESQFKYFEKGRNNLCSSMVYVDCLHQAVADRDGQLATLNQAVAERDGKLATLNQAVADRDGQLATLNQAVAERDGRLVTLNQAVADRDGQIAALQSVIESAKAWQKRSWAKRAFHRWREPGGNQKKIKLFKRLERSVRRRRDQLLDRGSRTQYQKKNGSASKKSRVIFIRTLAFHHSGKPRGWVRFLLFHKNKEPRRLLRRIVFKKSGHFRAAFVPWLPKKNDPINKQIENEQWHNIVPVYLEDNCPSKPIDDKPISIAVHLHLYYEDMMPKMLKYLKNITRSFSLFISVPEGKSGSLNQELIKTTLSNLDLLIIEEVCNKGRDISPFIVQFGERLLKYDTILHIHGKKTPHSERMNEWLDCILHSLLGSVKKVEKILALLSSDAKFVYPQDHTSYTQSPDGWGENYKTALRVVNDYTPSKVSKLPTARFAAGSMAWGTAIAWRPFLSLPLSNDDFLAEPLPPDGTIAHALERLPLLLANEVSGRNYEVVTGDYLKNRLYYEHQYDFSQQIKHSDIKVLAYYLPQFHSIPENDEWHGKGFTEWTKVTGSTPLFCGHNQQHIPHQDIGYYELHSSEILRQQAEIMKKSGVSGLIFYHYWFSGKLILEKPVQMLLNSPDIDMPYCFCWANENWTRRWDGNEHEILLGQHYTLEDAVDFIRYLIPFFKDPRYIKIDDRPVLYVYRPSSLPKAEQYTDAWSRECLKAGLKEPYLVAVLTRGTVDPREFNFDAGVERVLHDWTGGHVPDIRNELQFFEQFNGSVLSYEAVSDYYMNQSSDKEFTYFRSIIPQWDNTARYGNEAYIIHGSRPEKFQQWLGCLIEQAKKSLPEDRRIVVVNAWNEWAEGAHLEPDTQYGYAYLNAIGRALSGKSYADCFSQLAIPADKPSITIQIPPNIGNTIAKDPILQKKFSNCLKKSSIFNILNASIACCKELSNILIKDGISESFFTVNLRSEYSIIFRHVCVFGENALLNIISAAVENPGFRILCTSYSSSELLPKVEHNFSVVASEAWFAAIVAEPTQQAVIAHRICPDAFVCVPTPGATSYRQSPEVTTIVRFHKSGSINELERALLCLYAMQSTSCSVHLALQDLDKGQVFQIEKLMEFFGSMRIEIKHYSSEQHVPDLRSKMLNEGLLQCKTRYAAFLDYDDLLMPHAYEFLLERLHKTGKHITFGRVFSTICDTQSGIFFKRDRTYEYNSKYTDFINCNHAPLHSFLIDCNALNKKKLIYHNFHPYMEDYYLMLQIVRDDNTDWESLKINRYIGDYIHACDRLNTLAINDCDLRESVISSDIYKVCNDRICDIKKRLRDLAPENRASG